MPTMILGFLSCIGRLLEPHKRPWDSLLLTILDFFSLNGRNWHTQYEPLSDFSTEAVTIVSQRLARQHFKILNNSPLPSLYEAFAIIDGDERRRCLLQASSATPYPLLLIRWLLRLSLAWVLALLVARLLAPTVEILAILESGVLSFIQNYESKFLSGKGKGHPRTATVADTSPGHVPDLSHIQSQIGQLQSQLGSLLQHHPSGSIATLATGTLTAFHAKTGHPTWVLDFGANDHMTGTPSLLGSDATTIPTNLYGLPRPIPLFDSPPVQVAPASAARAPLKVYARRAPPSAPLPDSSLVSGTSPSPLVHTSVPPRQVIGIRSAVELEKKLNAASSSSRLAVLYFTATWCGPCRFIAPLFTSLAGKYPKVVFLKVDIDEARDAAARWNISSVPTFFFIKNGKEIDKVVESENQIEEEMIKSSPCQQYGNIVLDVLHVNVHVGKNILPNQGAILGFADLHFFERTRNIMEPPSANGYGDSFKKNLQGSIIGGKEDKAYCKDIEIQEPIENSEIKIMMRGSRPTIDMSYSLVTSRRYSSPFSPSGTVHPNLETGAPSLTITFNNCTLTTVSPAAGAVFGKRLSDGQVRWPEVHLIFTSAEGLVVHPATVNFHARIWAENRAHVVQASLCCVSSVGVPANLWV
ncbi:tetraticopeptide domain-containing thioredoxin [Actinidia rufa]|uniref:Tetraticopeptide domain-containing thioredoxin n=1 Tax=Actinidia rufa TaxID=165716 RepID=A0A7J0FXM8_9ERIC|nr:tetraticopeptide domain-containing thioredoxin [Actinidia rufa]